MKAQFADLSFMEEGREVASVRTQADADYVPWPVFGPFLQFLWDTQPRECFSVAMLAVTLGVAEDWLATLVCVRKLEDDDCKHKRRGFIVGDMLSIPILLRGKVLALFEVRIPGWWLPNARLSDLDCQRACRQVFRCSRTFSARGFPVRPTIPRISASSSRLFGLRKLTSLDRAYTSGEIPGRVNASAHYVHLDSNELAATWADELDKFQSHSAEYACGELRHNLSIAVPAQKPSAEVIEYLPRSDFEVIEILLKLRSSAEQDWMLAKRCYAEEERLSLIMSGARAAYAFSFGWAAILLGLRAPGEKTEYEEIDEKHILIRDKDSAQYREQRVGSLTTELFLQRDALATLLTELRKSGAATLQGKNLPMFPSLVQEGAEWLCVPTQRKSFHEACLRVGVDKDALPRMNFGRHYLACILNREVPEFSWLSAMGLQSGLIDGEFMLSMFGSAEREKTTSYVASWLSERGIKPVIPPKGLLK